MRQRREVLVIGNAEVFFEPHYVGSVAFHRLGVRLRRQASLQWSTSSQHRSHFFRQAKGRAQTTQTFVGKFCFFTLFIG
jgi:hypothetical protein